MLSTVKTKGKDRVFWPSPATAADGAAIAEPMTDLIGDIRGESRAHNNHAVRLDALMHRSDHAEYADIAAGRRS